MDIISISPAILAAVPLVTGLVEAIKKAGLPSRFAPVTSVVLGIAVSWVYAEGIADIFLSGVIVGLSASGLYSGGRATIFNGKK